jgi:hypothetical protein
MKHWSSTELLRFRAVAIEINKGTIRRLLELSADGLHPRLSLF